jgi:hypothetical protein
MPPRADGAPDDEDPDPMTTGPDPGACIKCKIIRCQIHETKIYLRVKCKFTNILFY